MSRRWCIGFFLLVAIAVVVPASLVLRGGISARPEPGSTEVVVARKVRSLLIPASAREARNPVVLEARHLAQGLAHFADHCATCHANDGSGSTSIGRALYPRAPDMRSTATQALTDGELFFIIENGVRLTGMPAWGVPGKPEESWKLVHFIRHLPALTAAEKAEMRRLNPRGLEEWRELQEEEEFLRGGPEGRPRGEHGGH